MGGQQAAFGAIYQKHYAAVLAFLRRRVPAEDSEDLCAAVFERAWRGFATLQDSSRPLPWLYGIARNTLKEHYRYRAARPHADGEDGLEDLQRADFADAVDLSIDINRALYRLSSADREVLQLFAWEHLSLADASSLLNCTPATARVRLHRARNRLAQALSEPMPLTPGDSK